MKRDLDYWNRQLERALPTSIEQYNATLIEAVCSLPLREHDLLDADHNELWWAKAVARTRLGMAPDWHPLEEEPKPKPPPPRRCQSESCGFATIDGKTVQLGSLGPVRACCHCGALFRDRLNNAGPCICAHCAELRARADELERSAGGKE